MLVLFNKALVITKITTNHVGVAVRAIVLKLVDLNLNPLLSNIKHFRNDIHGFAFSTKETVRKNIKQVC